jgi:hypothetical protein
VRSHDCLCLDGDSGRSGKGATHNPLMYGHEKSDPFIVSERQPNKGDDNKSSAEVD